MGNKSTSFFKNIFLGQTKKKEQMKKWKDKQSPKGKKSKNLAEPSSKKAREAALSPPPSPEVAKKVVEQHEVAIHSIQWWWKWW